MASSTRAKKLVVRALVVWSVICCAVFASHRRAFVSTRWEPFLQQAMAWIAGALHSEDKQQEWRKMRQQHSSHHTVIFVLHEWRHAHGLWLRIETPSIQAKKKRNSNTNTTQNQTKQATTRRQMRTSEFRASEVRRCDRNNGYFPPGP